MSTTVDCVRFDDDSALLDYAESRTAFPAIAEAINEQLDYRTGDDGAGPCEYAGRPVVESLPYAEIGTQIVSLDLYEWPVIPVAVRGTLADCLLSRCLTTDVDWSAQLTRVDRSAKQVIATYRVTDAE